VLLVFTATIGFIFVFSFSLVSFVNQYSSGSKSVVRLRFPSVMTHTRSPAVVR
jgi:hypothetical protein